ncbi:hypothetical protein ABB37_06960 [Leptomonas pyrrhocoris]|uniref:Uncharacterized protein n=1 Tax=Leptomonas pyrrhocoris TaxID=157538 RepID=A0A0N0DTK1_LEPPY|nr:hypothetical protein ABB37_06960 [Leptomonas pyrrhocoris]KPA77592.1 hypothetical protein ABB37_06960 [Leptomonas pyrrhocoris]|eukprot:XP_015656031.1 hypothetical protein ABB37_06960 [Leptomonas pyrrhocoris]
MARTPPPSPGNLHAISGGTHGSSTSCVVSVQRLETSLCVIVSVRFKSTECGPDVAGRCCERKASGLSACSPKVVTVCRPGEVATAVVW